MSKKKPVSKCSSKCNSNKKKCDNKKKSTKKCNNKSTHQDNQTLVPKQSKSGFFYTFIQKLF